MNEDTSTTRLADLLPGLRSGPVAFDEAVTPWRAWSPWRAADRLATTGARWAVAGGWAIDLHLGRPTREHDDLEVAVLAADVPAVLAAFPAPGWDWAVPTDGHLHPPTAEATAGTHQNWLWSCADRAFVLDIFRETHEADTWICRRDPAVRRPWTAVVRTTADGIPHVSAEVVLLFKAKYVRAKDEADLRAALPVLDGERRAWLAGALARVHPGHPWLRCLQAAG